MTAIDRSCAKTRLRSVFGVPKDRTMFIAQRRRLLNVPYTKYEARPMVAMRVVRRTVYQALGSRAVRISSEQPKRPSRVGQSNALDNSGSASHRRTVPGMGVHSTA